VPAPRFVNDSQENRLWLGLSGLWALGGLLAWFVAAGSQASWIVTSSWLVLFASLTCAVSAALRLPILSQSPSASVRADHTVWLLSSVANINWLGFFVLQAPDWPDALPVLMIWMIGEVWFHTAATRLDALPWLREAWVALHKQLASLGADQPLRSEVHQPVNPHRLLESNGCVERRVVEGHDEQGRRYLSGEICVRLTADQPSETIVVGFSPAFAGAPEVDVDCEADDVEVRLIHCTPTGMRIGIRALSGHEPLDLALQWFAVEVELGRAPSLAVTPRVLP
jgi:hypothetical protein